MLYPLSILALVLLALIHTTHGNGDGQISATPHSSDAIPYETRVYWMRRAISALAELDSPCPFAAFGSVVVNHTDTSDPKGKLVCMGVNQAAHVGNPTLHGEMATIENCSKVLTDLDGLYRLSPSEALKAYSQLSLYTTAEPCPMCASAIRWSGFAECIYGTSIETLINRGFGQISIPSQEVFAESTKLPGETVLIADVLANETDPYFSWQFNHSYPCPKGCERGSRDKFCKLQVTDHEL